MNLKAIFWDKKRKYYTLTGIFLVLIIVLGVVIIAGKGAADKAATTYNEQLPAYVKSLKIKSDSTVEGDFTKQPLLPQSPFAFLSSSYQAAASKHAAVNESVAYLASVNDSYSPHKKGELRGAIFYYQSTFFYTRGSARFATLRNLKDEKSKLKQAAIYATQFEAESKAVVGYIESIEKKTVRRPLYEKEVAKLLEVLRAYKKTADDCAAKLKGAASATNLQSETRKCSQTLQKQYDTSEKFYDYIVFYPRSVNKFTPTQTLIDQIKKQSGLSYSGKSLDAVQLETRINNKAAIIKSLLPVAQSDKQYDIKLAIIRTLHEQLEDDISAAPVDEKDKKYFQDILKKIKTSLPLYDEPLFAFGDDEPQTFIDKANTISRRIYDVSFEKRRTLSYLDFYTENRRQFAALEAPSFVQKELQTILADYDKALPYWKEYDIYNKRYLELTEKQEKAKDINEVLILLAEKRPLSDAMSKAEKNANIYMDNVDKTLRAMEEKMQQIDALTKYIAQQYDKLLQR